MTLFLFLAALGSDSVRPVVAAPVFLLPWEAGQRMYLFQGQNQGTHTGFYSRYAYDFAPDPAGEQSFTVRAARAGRVLEVKADYPLSPNCDPTYAGKSNYVVLDHGDGLGTLYMHLVPKSVAPTEGAWVREGEVLAQTGKTGFVCGAAHLHYTVVELPSKRSLDVPFSDQDTLKDGGRPKTGQWYISANRQGMYTITLPYAPRRARNGSGVPGPAVSFPLTSPVAP